MTGVAGWSAELLAVAIADITSTLLGPSVFGQLRALSAASYDMVDGMAVRAPLAETPRHPARRVYGAVRAAMIALKDGPGQGLTAPEPSTPLRPIPDGDRTRDYSIARKREGIDADQCVSGADPLGRGACRGHG